MDAVAAEGQERDPIWRLVIGGMIAIVGSTVALWPWLPEPMAVQWSIEGTPTNQMSKWLWLLISCGAWTFVSSSLVGLRGTPGWPKLLMVLIAGILIAGHVTTLENNLGADQWRQAEPLDLPAAILLVVLGMAAVGLAQRKLEG